MVERNELQATKSRGGTLGAKSCLIKACRKGHTPCGSSLVTFRKRQNSGDNSSDGCGGWGRAGRWDHDAGPRCKASVCRGTGGHMAFLICPGRSKRRPGPPSGEPWTLGERSRSSEQVTHPSPPAAAAPSLRNPGPPPPPGRPPPGDAVSCFPHCAQSRLKRGLPGPRGRRWQRAGTSPYRGLCARRPEPGGRRAVRCRLPTAACAPRALPRWGGAALPPRPSARPAVSNR